MENKYEVTNLPCICGSDGCDFLESAGHVITRLARSQPTSPEPAHRTPVNPNTISDWSPLDDGIEVVLPNGSDRVPSREEVDAYIFGILIKLTTKRRLPVFAEFCKEH